MAPGQVKKCTKSSSTIEGTNGITVTTNNEVIRPTSSIPTSNCETNNTLSTNQVNQAMPTSISANTSRAEGGTTSKKRCRGPTRGIGLVKRNEVAGKKLQVVIDREHGRPLFKISLWRVLHI
ncbi:uncharacterized protein LOC116019630 [Ipomoea triloba]|uniref:uncharacterized protein LOC116019630 n=1 Tax=Ipomoea triloba TaxID=35885 RepID=UPI00125DD47B|nr:uncharacterized protein LOC116019630 [Ipomoea triloba]